MAGPFGLVLIPHGAAEHLRLVDEVSLAVIAFAAGSELYLRELRGRFNSIAWVSIANTVLIPIFGGVTVLLLADYIPFLNGMSTAARVAVALLIGTILVARSPSSAIAIVNEMRAKGPFTQTVLGVTMITDAVVIILFAVNSSVVSAILSDLPFDLVFLALLLGELALAVASGYLVGRLLAWILSWHARSVIKILALLIAGLSVFVFAHWLRDWSHANLPFEIFIEPLLACLIASFYATNYTGYRPEYLKVLAEISPAIYVIFCTLDALVRIWPIALALFGARVVGVFVASFAGGAAGGDPMKHNLVS